MSERNGAETQILQFTIVAGSENDDRSELYQERLPDLFGILSKNITKSCSMKGLKKRLPIVEWLPNYKASFLLHDFIAGMSVGLTAIPQGEIYVSEF